MPQQLIKKFPKRYWIYLFFGFAFLGVFIFGLYSGVLLSSFSAVRTDESQTTNGIIPAFSLPIGILALGAMIKIKGRLSHG